MDVTFSASVFSVHVFSVPDVNAEQADGETALMRGARSPEIVRLLLAHGARIDASSNFGGETALHWACQGSDVSAVRELLKAGADVNATDTHGRTPLARAAEGNQSHAAEALLAAGADPLAADKERVTPLILAAQHAGPPMLGAMLRKQNPRGPAAAAAGYALGWAIHERRLENARALIAWGADPNVADDDGYTPLIASAGMNGSGFTRLLLDHGANPAARTHDGRTAWDMALANSATDVLRVLGGPPPQATAGR
ncbi:MAG TPA: ankyrin repeat domain-containing protein [Tepidisphaeraceae bacterium]